jgi:hypothetical protein
MRNHQELPILAQGLSASGVVYPPSVWRALFAKSALLSRILPIFAQSGFWVNFGVHQGSGSQKYLGW